MSTEWIKPMEWKAEGIEPSDTLKESGFPTGYKPPADVMNYFFNRAQNSIEQLQEEVDKSNAAIVENKEAANEALSTEKNARETADNDLSKKIDKTNEVVKSNKDAQDAHIENKENPHNVTAKQLGLENVDNTSDSEKSVKFASEAGVGRKVEHALKVRFDGGSTEGTDLFTYDGSTSKSVNITPAKIGASKEGHTHTLDDVSETSSKKIVRIVNATTTDRVAFTATVEGITELYAGLCIIFISDEGTLTTEPTLNINGLGAVGIRRKLSFGSQTVVKGGATSFLCAKRPHILLYDNSSTFPYWIATEFTQSSAQDLYGTVPLTSGGTGVNSKDLVQGAFYALPDVEDDDNDDDTTELRGHIGTLPIEVGGTGATTKEKAIENLGIAERLIKVHSGVHDDNLMNNVSTNVPYITKAVTINGFVFKVDMSSGGTNQHISINGSMNSNGKYETTVTMSYEDANSSVGDMAGFNYDIYYLG